MPVNITVTKREVKNKTGVDGSVSSYDSASSAKQVKNYHVVVISKLPFFKLEGHSEDDVVHFMVRREYADFEKLQHDLLMAFPELKLPAFPRKFHVFMNESDIEERMISFDCIVKIVARHRVMCTSPTMLEFLGFERTSDKKYFKARRDHLQKKEDDAKRLSKKNDKVYGDRLQEIDRGFFGTGSSEEPFSDDSQTRSQPFTADSIFEEDKKVTRESAKISVFKDVDEEKLQLFIPSGAKLETSQADNSPLLNNLEDNSELLTVTDSLDDVLKIVDKKKSSTKKVPLSGSGSGARGLFDVDESKDRGVTDMGGDDIMKYIQQNQADDDDDLDLFG